MAPPCRRPALLSAIALAGLAIAAAAPAQTLNQLTAQQNAAWAEQQAANQRAIAQHNELEALDAKIQTEARLRQLREQMQSDRGPDPVYSPRPGPEPVPPDRLAADYPSIPDAMLAASRERVLKASANRR